MSTNEDDIERYIARVMKSLNPIENFSRYFYLGLLLLIFLFSIAVSVQTGAETQNSFKVFLLAAGTSLIVVTAATAVGCLLGFLFGIPRSLQGGALMRPVDAQSDPAASPEQSRTAASVARAFMSNTSLEEISDWLTKIIIGLGLVQFQLLIDYLYRSALYAASFVATQPIPAGDLTKISYDAKIGSPFFFSLIVVGLIAGCLFAYLETRTRLMLLFIDAEDVNKDRSHERTIAANAGKVPVSVSQQPVQQAKDSKGQRPAPIALAPTIEDVAVTKVPFEALKNAKEVIGWASAQARTGNFAEAEWGLLDALQKYPEDNSIRELIVEVRRLKKDVLGALKMGVEIADRTTDRKKRYEILRSALYEALYVDSPDGFTQALDISQKLLDMPESQKNATIYLWRACAMGQKYQWLKDKNTLTTTPEMKAIWEEALRLVAKVVELAPNYESPEQELMRSLYEGRFGGEDDLKVFKSDEFDTFMYQGKA